MRYLRSPVMIAPALLLLIGLASAIDAWYLLEQYVGFYNTVVAAEDIDRIRARGDLEPATEQLFDRVHEIREFAYEELGLRRSTNFTRYTELDRNHLVSVVSAVESDSLRRHMWNYPVLGPLFYRGFYDEDRARREAERLEARGYDVHIRRVNAFSSLGYFSDPVYSFMADYDDYRLANLIIHEEMHANTWITGQNVYNEEIATFLGDEGAAQFIAHKYGRDSEEYRAIAAGRADREAYREWIRGVYAELGEAYRTLRTRDERLEAKEHIFAEARARLRERYDKLFVTERYRHLAEAPLNNAVIDAGYSYAGDLSLYYDLYEELGGDLAAAVRIFRESAAHPNAPKTFVAAALDGIRLAAGEPEETDAGF